MSQKNLKDFIQRFSSSHLGLIGDLMLDEWIIGRVERISPEAPIPVVKWEGEKKTGGGACNTALNITSLRGKVSLFGLVGKDRAGSFLLNFLQKRGVEVNTVLQTNTRPTIRKIRIVGKRGPEQQIVRIDKEDTKNINSSLLQTFLQHFKKKIKDLALIIFSDYNKGFITQKLAQRAIALCQKNNKYVIVDTKPEKLSYFQGASLLTPNLEEAEAMSGIKINNDKNETIEEAGRVLQKKLNLDLIITRSEKGMTVFEGEKIIHIPTEAQEVYDVSGAGDTVVATLALALASGASLEEAARLANKAAGIVVGKRGTASVEQGELMKAINY